MIFGKKKNQTSRNGFTIIETMIFLAISGLMVAVTINSIIGKQGNTEFKTGLNILRDNLSLSLTNILNGNYQLPSGHYCLAGSAQPEISTTPSSSGSCTFLGEVVSFEAKTYTVYTVLGRTHETSNPNLLATNITQAMPSVSPLISQSFQIPESIQIKCLGVLESKLSSANSGCQGSQPIGSFALISFTGFNGENSSGTSLQAYQGSSTSGTPILNNGSLQVELIPIPDSSLNNKPSVISSLISNLNNCTDNINTVCIGKYQEPINPQNGIILCLNSGTNNESSDLIFGGNNSPSSVTIKLFGSPGC
jgi:hypothetical protein